MEKTGKKSLGDKLSTITDFVKNAKFLVLTTIVLVVLGVALLSGDGKNIVQSLYENITGKKHESFSPVNDYSNETYIILKYKLSDDSTIKIENAEITIYEESDISHKYHVEYKEKTYFYHVKKTQGGTWQIKQE